MLTIINGLVSNLEATEDVTATMCTWALGDLDVTKLSLLGTALLPRFWHLKFVTSEQSTTTNTELLRIAANFDATAIRTDTPQEPETAPAPKRSKSVFVTPLGRRRNDATIEDELGQ